MATEEVERRRKREKAKKVKEEEKDLAWRILVKLRTARKHTLTWERFTNFFN